MRRRKNGAGDGQSIPGGLPRAVPFLLLAVVLLLDRGCGAAAQANRTADSTTSSTATNTTAQEQ